MAPFAPHLAEEVWEQIGIKESLSYAPYPQAEEKYLQDEVVTIVIQINGKLRPGLNCPKDHPQEAVLEVAKSNAHIAAYLDGHKIEKMIFVPNKLLNIVLAT